jgi:ABC-type sugar transport system substrate-binding protein
MNDDMIQGCLQAIINAGVEDIILVGFNGDSPVLDLIYAGEIDGTVAQQPWLMGWQAVMEAYKAIRGETIEFLQEVPAALITRENVEEFMD